MAAGRGGRRLHAAGAAKRRRRRRARRGSSSCCRPMPEPGGAYLPRALSAAWAGRGRDRLPAGRARRRAPAALAAPAGVDAGAAGPRLRAARRRLPILVGGGIGAAILPWLVRDLPGPATTLLGFREQRHAVCAALIDADATVVLEPTYVTEPLARLLPADGNRLRLRAGPDAAGGGRALRRACRALPAGDGGGHGLRVRRLLRLRGRDRRRVEAAVRRGAGARGGTGAGRARTMASLATASAGSTSPTRC